MVACGIGMPEEMTDGRESFMLDCFVLELESSDEYPQEKYYIMNAVLIDLYNIFENDLVNPFHYIPQIMVSKDYYLYRGFGY